MTLLTYFHPWGGGVIVKSTVDDLHIVVFVAVAVIINKNIKVMHTLLNVLICDYHLVVLICLYGQAKLHIKRDPAYCSQIFLYKI